MHTYSYYFRLYRRNEHAEISENGRRMTAESVADERVGEAGQHARVEDAEAGLVLPSHLAGWSQQVLQCQSYHRHHSYKQQCDHDHGMLLNTAQQHCLG